MLAPRKVSSPLPAWEAWPRAPISPMPRGAPTPMSLPTTSKKESDVPAGQFAPLTTPPIRVESVPDNGLTTTAPSTSADAGVAAHPHPARTADSTMKRRRKAPCEKFTALTGSPQKPARRWSTWSRPSFAKMTGRWPRAIRKHSAKRLLYSRQRSLNHRWRRPTATRAGNRRPPVRPPSDRAVLGRRGDADAGDAGAAAPAQAVPAAGPARPPAAT